MSGLGPWLSQQSVSLFKNEDLSSISRIHMKRPCVVAFDFNSVSQEVETGGSLGFAGQPAFPPPPRVRNPASGNRKVDGSQEVTPKVDCWPHMHVHKCVYTRNKHTKR